MASLSVVVSHNLGQAEAAQRLKEEFGRVKQRFGQEIGDLAEQWDDHVLRFGFTTFGVPIQGTVAAEESQVTVTAELPLAAMMFRSVIEREIRGELERALG